MRRPSRRGPEISDEAFSVATILVVDDHEGVRQMVSLALGRAGHDVSLAADGQEALAILRGKHVDIMIADLLMPSMCGLDLIAAAKRSQTDLQGVVMTGSDLVESGALRGNRGADAVLYKPFLVKDLLAAVERCRPPAG
jgi:CheY-like chemotaxis protein